jgi:hypothetical protein
MPVLGTLPNDKAKLVALYVTENSNYQTNLSRLSLFKTRAQNPKETPEFRAQAVKDFNAMQKKVQEGRRKLAEIQDSVDKLEGGKDLVEIQQDINDLFEQKSLLIDPEGQEARSIDDKIEELVKPFQNAYSKSVGARVSETVARTKVFKREIPTFNEPSRLANQAITTPEVPVSGTKPDAGKKPEVTGDTGKSKGNVVEAAQLPNPPKGTSTTPAPLDTTIFEPTFTTGGVPAGYIPESEVATNKAGSVSDIAEKYGLSEALFKNIPSLKLIFEDYVNPKKKMTDDEFVRRIRNDVWYKKNSAGIKERFVQYYNYRDLQESGQAQGTTQYEQDIEGIVRTLEKRAVEIGSAAASDPTALRNAAENIYLTNKEKDTTFIDDFLASSIRPVAGTIGGKTTQGYSGAALQNYNALVSAARNNGFQVADIIPGGANVDQVLQGIASGKIDVNRVVADARKLAAQGQPQYVRDLLAQGYNLDQVFKPYRTAMANVLEIGDPDQIDLNDPLLRSAITDKGDMNLYNFKKALRQDSRWQYTEQAKKDVSTAALGVLRDFGFQG